MTSLSHLYNDHIQASNMHIIQNTWPMLKTIHESKLQWNYLKVCFDFFSNVWVIFCYPFPFIFFFLIFLIWLLWIYYKFSFSDTWTSKVANISMKLSYIFIKIKHWSVVYSYFMLITVNGHAWQIYGRNQTDSFLLLKKRII